MNDVWVVVPVFNEDGVIASVIKDLERVFPHIVCVDDGSSDRSAIEIAATGAHLVRHPVNLGQGAALQTGLHYALRRPGAKYLVTFDADGQHRVEDALALVEVVSSGACDVALGSRFLGEPVSVPPHKRIILRAVAALSPSSRKLQLTDAHNGLRAMHRHVADNLHITSNGMGHASEIVTYLSSGQWRVQEVPVTIEYTEYSKAKGQSVVNGVNILFDLLMRRGAKGVRR